MELLTPKDYMDAIRVQDACNLSGVVHSFSRILPKIRATLESNGTFSTAAVNGHPIAVLYASKIASLAGCEVYSDFAKAYEICSAFIKAFEDKSDED